MFDDPAPILEMIVDAGYTVRASDDGLMLVALCETPGGAKVERHEATGDT